jgi:hypothetical protein
MKPKLLLLATIGTAIWADAGCVFAGTSLGWHHWHPPFAAGNTGLIFRDLAGFKFQKAETHIEGDLVEYLIKFQSPGPGRFAVHITTCGTARVPEGPESDAITKWIWIERNKLFRPAGMLDSVRSTQRSTVRVEGGCAFCRVTHYLRYLVSAPFGYQQPTEVVCDTYLMGHAGSLFEFYAVFPKEREAAGTQDCQRFLAELTKSIAKDRDWSDPDLNRVRSLMNARQIGLAMHDYHDEHRRFPPAVIMGPDGKTPRSWRVELLPYLRLGDKGLALYRQYRLNEPWDSPSNKQVLEQIPEPYRSPFDDPKSTNSGYFALVGPGTAFEGSNGVRIRDISDGTQGTLLVVESRRNIPWTKPEDIPFDPNKELPELGGFMRGQLNAVFADGTMRTLDLAKVGAQLKWLIVPNDGHEVVLPPDREAGEE